MKKIVQIKMVAAAVVISLVGGLAISQAKTVGQRTLELVRANKGLSIPTNEGAVSISEVFEKAEESSDVFAVAVETPDVSAVAVEAPDVSAKPVATTAFRKPKVDIVATDDTILNFTPKDAFFCVRINDLDSALGNLDKDIAGVPPVAMLLQKIAKMHDPMLANVRTGDGFAAFGVTSPGQRIPNHAVMLPVKSFDTFVSNNAQAQWPDASGIVTIKSQLPNGNLLAVSAGNGKYALLTDESQKNAIFSMRGMLDGIKKESKSCLVKAGKIKDGSASVYITLSKKHIADIVKVAMQGMKMDTGETKEMDTDDFDTDDFDETEVVEL